MVPPSSLKLSTQSCFLLLGHTCWAVVSLKKKIQKALLWFLSSASNTKRSLFWGNYTDVFIPGGNFRLHVEVSEICQLSVIFLKVCKQQDKVLCLLQEVYWQQDKWESLLDTATSWVFSKWKIKQDSYIETELLQAKNRNRKVLRLSLYPLGLILK